MVAEVIGSNRRSVAAAAREARRVGLRPLVLTTSLEGEAREVSPALVSVLRECMESGRPARPPVCLLAGGETTVTVRGDGRGGRNQEIAVAAVEPLARCPADAVVASLATDGIDGASDAAGGVADGQSADRARALGLAPAAAFLAASDSSGFLAPLGDLIVTGPTGTNVVDLTVLVTGGQVVSRGGRRGYTGRNSVRSREPRGGSLAEERPTDEEEEPLPDDIASPDAVPAGAEPPPSRRMARRPAPRTRHRKAKPPRPITSARVWPRIAWPKS